MVQKRGTARVVKHDGTLFVVVREKRRASGLLTENDASRVDFVYNVLNQKVR